MRGVILTFRGSGNGSYLTVHTEERRGYSTVSGRKELIR